MVYLGVVVCVLFNISFIYVFFKFKNKSTDQHVNEIEVGVKGLVDETTVNLKALAERACLAKNNPSLTAQALENRKILYSLAEIGEGQVLEIQTVRLKNQAVRAKGDRTLFIVK
jgi:hypothetical protein